MANKDGMITKKDFMAMMEKKWNAMDKGNKGMLSAADGDGMVTFRKDMQAMANKDGMVSKREFMAMMEKKWNAMDHGNKGMLSVDEVMRIFADNKGQ